MSATEKVIDDLNVAKLMLCNPQVLTTEMCVKIGQAINSAIDLLKEQEPRILSLEEAIDGENGLEIDPYVFVEIKGRGDVFIGAVNDASHYNYPNLSFDVGECFQINRCYKGSTASKIYINTDYMKIVRCWTHKPSKEQREAVKWENETPGV